MGELAAFMILSLVTLIPAVVVVTSSNIVRAALSLVPTFLGVTGLYVMLQAEFVAGIQVLIYAGAITVLILFVIMLTEGGTGLRLRQVNEQETIGAMVAVVIAALLVVGITRTGWHAGTGALPAYTPGAIGQSFLGPNLLVFEGTSIVLLVSLIGAIIIARKEE